MATDNVAQSSVRRKWTTEDLAAEAARYETRGQFRKGSPEAYRTVAKRGLLDVICQNMTPKYRKWTTDDLTNEALKFTTRRQFYLESPAAYSAAQKRKILDQICTHMTTYRWTDDELQSEALKYQTRCDFWRFSINAYNAALDRGVLDQICQHMISRRQISDTVYLWRPENLSYYKVGVTTGAFGYLRMWQVADELGVKPEMLLFVSHPEPPRVENQILKLGLPVRFNRKFDGYSEFRWFSPQEIQMIRQLLN